MFGKQLYIHDAQSHSVCANSRVFIAAYLHTLVFGRPEHDIHAQEYFGHYCVMFRQNRFVELTQVLLQAKQYLEELEEFGSIEDPEDSFYKGAIFLIHL